MRNGWREKTKHAVFRFRTHITERFTVNINNLFRYNLSQFVTIEGVTGESHDPFAVFALIGVFVSGLSVSRSDDDDCEDRSRTERTSVEDMIVNPAR